MGRAAPSFLVAPTFRTVDARAGAVDGEVFSSRQRQAPQHHSIVRLRPASVRLRHYSKVAAALLLQLPVPSAHGDAASTVRASPGDVLVNKPGDAGNTPTRRLRVTTGSSRAMNKF